MATTAATSLDSSGAMTFPYGGSYQYSSSSGMKNRIINGNFQIDQKAESYRRWGGPSTGDVTKVYNINGGGQSTVYKTYPTLDKWYVDQAGFVNLKALRVLNLSQTYPTYDFNGNLLGTGTAHTPYMMELSYQGSGGGRTLVYQVLESQYVSDLTNRTVTLSYSIMSNSVAMASQVSASVWRLNSKDALDRTKTTGNYPGVTTVLNDCTLIANVGHSMQVRTFDVSGNSIPRYSLTFNAGDCTKGLLVAFNPFATSPDGGFGGSADKPVVRLCNVQLERGDGPTPFDYRPYSYELELCQRYTVGFNPSSMLQQTGYYPFECVDGRNSPETSGAPYTIFKMRLPVKLRTEPVMWRGTSNTLYNQAISTSWLDEYSARYNFYTANTTATTWPTTGAVGYLYSNSLGSSSVNQILSYNTMATRPGFSEDFTANSISYVSFYNYADALPLQSSVGTDWAAHSHTNGYRFNLYYWYDGTTKASSSGLSFIADI